MLLISEYIFIFKRTVKEIFNEHRGQHNPVLL